MPSVGKDEEELNLKSREQPKGRTYRLKTALGYMKLSHLPVSAAKPQIPFEADDEESLDSAASTTDNPDSSPLSPSGLPVAQPSFKGNSECLFSNEFFEVRRSKLAGWGCFASRDLSRGTTLLTESPILAPKALTPVWEEFGKISDEDKAIIMSLHAFNPLGVSKLQAICTTNA